MCRNKLHFCALKHLYLIILFLYALCLMGQAQDRSYCQLQGPVYVEESAVYAQYKVYLEASEAFAELLVYKTQNQLFADRPGLWFMTPTKAQARFTIAFVTDKAAADFSIFYIDQESFAGCK